MNPSFHSAENYRAPLNYPHILNHQAYQLPQTGYPTLPQQPLQHNLYPQFNVPNHYPIPPSHGVNQVQNLHQRNLPHPPTAANNNHETSIAAKLKAIEDEIENSRYTCYTLWLYLLLTFSVLSLAIESYYYVKGWNLIPFMICFLTSFWAFCHSMLAVRALHKGSLEDAVKAVWFMKGYIIPLVTFIIHFIRQRLSHPNMRVEESLKTNFGLIFAVFALILHVFVTLAGAKKIRKLLKQRDELKSQNATQDYFVL